MKQIIKNNSNTYNIIDICNISMTKLELYGMIDYFCGLYRYINSAE